MTARLALKVHAFVAPFTFVLATVLVVCSWQHTGASARVPPSRQQIALQPNDAVEEAVPGVARSRNESSRALPSALDALLDAIEVMQEKYFEVGTGSWPSSVDWTAAVFSTTVSATLSTLVSSIDYATCADTLAWDNLINRYFGQTSVFYFGENALSLRQQAYDDMLWVVLGWLENIKLMDLYSSMRSSNQAARSDLLHQPWHGTQLKPAAAHRARLFYDLASHGWDTSLCNGGMVWNRHLRPYKNSITNELFISASISMYLYFPGDDNDSPFLTTTTTATHHQPGGSNSANGTSKRNPNSNSKSKSNPLPHNPTHLSNAIKAYHWLRISNMTNPHTPGLYADGYHISGWHRSPDGRIDPGTGKCDDLNMMVYTYNQGVVLSGLRGLWLATGERSYLEDGHELVGRVVQATGWDDRDAEGRGWQGLGRGGVLEEYCDSGGGCSQDGQTFKGIFFHHLAEFCRGLWGAEEEFVSGKDAKVNSRGGGGGFDQQTWEYHLCRCDGYRDWVEHNARAAARTRDEEGRFGMWWGREYPDNGTGTGTGTGEEEGQEWKKPPALPAGAVDYANSPAADGAYQRIPPAPDGRSPESGRGRRDANDRGRGRTVETQSGGVAVLRARWQWESGAGV